MLISIHYLNPVSSVCPFPCSYFTPGWDIFCILWGLVTWTCVSNFILFLVECCILLCITLICHCQLQFLSGTWVSMRSILYINILMDFIGSMDPDSSLNKACHDDVVTWKHFLHYWAFVRWIHQSTVDFHLKVELWCFLCSWPQETAEEALLFLVIWDLI